MNDVVTPGTIALSLGANDANCPGPFSNHIRIDRQRGRFEVDQRAFMDEDTFRLEREKIFTKCWLFVGHDSEIPQPKDFITRNIGGFDLIFNRDRDGNVHAFYNYCTHRAPILNVQERGNANVFTCPYHGWVFGADGALKDYGAAYGYDEDFNSDGHYNLKAVPRLENYRGFWFMNMNQKAVDLATYLGSTKDVFDIMADQAGDAGLEVIRGEQHLINGGNWKVITDNFVDMYHGPSLHSSYFNDYAPSRTQNAEVGGSFIGGSGGFENGHNYAISRIGLGRPVAKWIPAFGEAAKPLIEAKKQELIDRFGAERAEIMAEHNRNMVVFPNLVVTDNVSLNVRTVFPESVDTFRMNIWTLGVKGEPEAIRDVRLRNHLSFVGPAGFAHPDDFEIFDLQRQAYHTTPHKWLDYSKGMRTDTVKDNDRRKVEGQLLNESQQRAWWTQWDRLVSGVETLE